MIKTEIKGFNDFVKKVGALEAKPVVMRAIKKGIFYMEREAKKNTPTDQGDLKNAYQTEFKNLEGNLKNSRKYGVYVHEGTEPHFVPIKVIQPWADRHGIPAIFVQRAIAKKGTKAQPWLQEVADSSEKKIQGYFNSEVEKYFDKAL